MKSVRALERRGSQSYVVSTVLICFLKTFHRRRARSCTSGTFPHHPFVNGCLCLPNTDPSHTS